MKKLFLYTSFSTLLLLSTSAFATTVPAKKIAIVVPAEIQAMTEIIQGFESTLQKTYSGPIDFKVANTQGDINLQHATILALRDQGYDIIAPIGSDATAMTLSMVKNTPVLSLASDLSETQRQQLHPCNVAVVHDEISSEQQLAFIHQALPTIKTITLIYSASDKIFPEVTAAQAAAKKLGLTIKPMMAATLLDLQSVANNLPANTQAIFILKDMQIVSGIGQLAKIAQSHHIPLISSDDGSVQNGAAFALGVHEKQIGINGALLAADILNGKAACSLPIAEMRQLTVFINPDAMKRMGVSLPAIEATAKKFHYAIEITQ